jgi:hypothetical protein
MTGAMNLTQSWQRLSECIAPQTERPAAHAHAAGSARTAKPTWQALFSNRARPLLLPLHHRHARKNGMRFFLPQVWRKCYANVRLRAHDYLGKRARLPLLTLNSATTATLADELALIDSPQLAFLIGTPGPYQKASMLVMSPQGEPKSLVKIALGEHANTMVKSEAAWLRTLSTHAATSEFVPQLLRAGRTHNGYRYVAQSIVGGKISNSVFTPLHADFLRRLGTVDARVNTFPRSPARQLLRDQYTKLEPMLTESRRALIGDALNECVHLLNDWRGPFVISHGDFAFWNIHTQGDHLYAFDWEYASAETSPLFDLFHFHLIAPASSNRTLTIRDMKHALSPARAFAVLTYPEFDWSEPIVAAHGLAYLLHTLTFYGLSRGELIESHPVIRSYCRLIEDRAQWMK